jgi:hypothetical protein
MMIWRLDVEPQEWVPKGRWGILVPTQIWVLVNAPLEIFCLDIHI